MKHLLTLLAAGALLHSAGFALDVMELTRSMQGLARNLKINPQIQHELYSGKSEISAQQRLHHVLSKVQSSRDLQDAISVANQFAMGASHEQKAASRLQKLLKQRALFLGLAAKGVTRLAVSNFVQDLQPVPADSFLKPEDFMVEEVHPVELVLYVESQKWEDRKKHVEAMLQRHECDVHSSFHWDGDQEQHNTYATCKDYIARPLVNHFGGEVAPNFEVEVELIAGGWFSKDSMSVSIMQPEGSMEKASLQYLQSLVEANPFQYIHDHNLANLMDIGQKKEIGGESRLFLKNARAKIWYKAAGGSRSEAIYFSEKDYGDMLLKGGLK